MITKDFRELQNEISICTERVTGRQNILKRKLFVMFNFLSERGYVLAHADLFELARNLDITTHAGTVSRYRKRFPAEWAAELRLIEAAQRARENMRVDSGFAIVESDSNETATEPLSPQRNANRNVRSESVYHFDVGENEIQRLREMMSCVRDTRDNRGKKYELVDFLIYYVFRMLSDDVYALGNADHSKNDAAIMPHLKRGKKPENFQWVKDVVNTRTDSGDFRRALLSWLKGFEIDAEHSEEFEKLLLGGNQECDGIMRSVRAIVSFSVAQPRTDVRPGDT